MNPIILTKLTFSQIRGVAEGIAVLHGLHITHGDLKGTSIAINDMGEPLIADFGVAQVTMDALLVIVYD